MPRTFCAFVMLLVASSLCSHQTIAKPSTQLLIDSGEPGSHPFRLGVALISLVKVIVLPKKSIDVDLVTGDRQEDGAELRLDHQEGLAAFLSDQPAERFQSVMTFKAGHSDEYPPLELIARADVPADVIYDIAKALSENGPFLNTINKHSWDLSLDQPLLGSRLTIHPGALRYYQESGGLNPGNPDNLPIHAHHRQGNQTVPTANQESTFFVYFGGSDARLDTAAQDQIAAACRYASNLTSPLMQFSGDLIESQANQASALTKQRLESIVSAIDQHTDCPPDRTIVTSDAADIALPTDLLGEDADRIGITIMTSDNRP